MANSGSFTTTSCEGRSLTFNWSVKSQNVANNQTTINWSLVGSGSYTYGWVTCGNFKVTIDGKQVYYSSTRLNVYSGTTVASGTYTFTHDNSGNKSFTAYAEAGIYYVAVNCSGSGTWSLPSIARNATITNAPNFNDEANPTITYTNPAGTNVSSLQACISLTGSSSDVPYRDISKTGTSYTFNLTTAERNTLRQATTGKSRTVYFYIKTIINGTTLYSSYGVTFSIVNGNPTIGTVTYQDSNATTVAITGNNQQIIQNQSTLQLNIGTVTALKYATISKVEYSINSYVVDITSSYTNPVAIGTINYSTNFNLNVIVTDSRGFVTTKSVTVTMLAWKLPYATINIARQSNFYAETDMLVNAYYSSVDSHNSVTIQYKYKKTSDSTYSSPVTIANNTQVTASFDNQYDYDFQFIVSDLFGQTTYNVVLPKGIPLMFFDRNLNSVALNGFPTNPNSFYSGSLQLDNCIYIGSQLMYDHFTTSTSGTFQLLGAYDYQLIEGITTAITIPTGYEVAYRLSAQVTTQNSNTVTIYLNNIATYGSSTWSGNTYRILTGSRIFKASEITLEPTLNYSTKNGINLKVTNATAYPCNVYNITLHAYLVKSDQAIAVAEAEPQMADVEG